MMKQERITRREFLKLLGAASLGLAARPVLDGNLPARGNNQQIPNILVVVFDAFAGTNASLYGYVRQTTPNLERIAKKAAVYHRHYAAGNFTSPGTASILSGVYPWMHRALHYRGMVTGDYIDRQIFNLLSPTHTSFAYAQNFFPNILFDQYQSDIDQWVRFSDLSLRSYSLSDRYFQKDFPVAFRSEELILRNLTGLTSSFYLARFHRTWLYAAEQSFARRYREQFPRGIPNYISTVFFTVEQAIDWLQTQLEEQPAPYLGYVHLLPPHEPYVTRREFADSFDDGWQPPAKPLHFFNSGWDDAYLADTRREYDQAIAYVDAEFGRLFDYLEGSGKLENTILVFTSDHGEMFERGISLHNTPTLYEPLIRVPLMVWAPGLDERLDVHTPTSCVDLLPTLLHLSGQPTPSWIEGALLPGFSTAAADEQRSVYVVEAKENAMHAPLTKATLALIKGRYKLVHYFGYPLYEDVYEFYDLEDDPEELVDLYPQGSAVIEAMKAEMAAKLEAVNQPYL